MIRWAVSVSAMLLPGLLIVFQNNSYADDCIKLVAEKYCLGGSFAEAIEAYKKNPGFKRDSAKIDDRVTLDQVVFIDESVLDLDKAMVVLDGFHGKIVSIKFFPVTDGENDNGYDKTLASVHRKYCSSGRVLRRESTALICDGGDFLVMIGVVDFGQGDQVFKTPVFAYSEPRLISEELGRGY